MNSLSEYPSYVSPSRIRTLIVPVGEWKRKTFKDTVKKVKDYSEIRLLDITPIDSALFTPQGFPNGRLLFDFNILAHNDTLDLFLYDFEPFRKTFVVIGLVNDNSSIDENLKNLKDKYPTAISFNLIYLNEEIESKRTETNRNVFYSNINNPKNFETIMCDIGRNFLEALTHYYSSYKHVTLRSPGAIGGNSIAKTVITRYGQNNAPVNPTTAALPSSSSSKRLSSFEMTTNSLKRSASIKLASTLSSSDSRAQQKSRGRQLKILGNFQLLAGRYVDALASFIESVTVLYKLRDFLWLGSALDGIAICFISLSYLQMPFQIPEIVDIICPVQTMESPSDSSDSLPRNNASAMQVQMQSPRNSLNATTSFINIDVEQINLPILIKNISEKVLYYYELSLINNSEYAPQVVYCNLLLKTLTFMVACHNSTSLTPEILNVIIHGKPNDTIINSEVSEKTVFTSCDIYLFANRLYELQLKDMTSEMQCKVYISLAQVFKSLGFVRKEVFALRLLLLNLATTTEKIYWHSDYKEIFDSMLDLYGISKRDPCNSLKDASDMNWLSLQQKALNLCLLVAKRFGDYRSIARYSTLLITKYTHLLSQSEQHSLITDYIQPCIEKKLISSYWDPFLVRDGTFQRLEFDEPGTDTAMIPVETPISNINKSLVTEVKEKIDTEEVFNPFKSQNRIISTSNSINVTNSTFIIGDKAEFACILQNPFKFDLHITALQFDQETFEYCELQDSYLSESNPYTVKAESLSRIAIPLILKKATFEDSHSISSLSISVFGLPSQNFRFIKNETRLEIEQSNEKEQHDFEEKSEDNERCIYNNLMIKILPEQPQLQIINKSNIAENSLMMLDGTKTDIIVNIRNKSLNCTIDYLQFHAITNIERDLKNDYWKNLKADELYAVEKQLKYLQDSCIKISNAPKSLKPGEVVQLKMELDVTSAPFDFSEFQLIVNYGMVARNEDNIYLKELVIPYEVTVRKTIEVPSLDIIPLSESIISNGSDVDWIKYINDKLNTSSDATIHDYILLLLDYRNSWLDGLYLNVEFDDFKSKKYLVEAGHTLRVIIPIKRIDFMEKGFAKKRIPQIVQGRQFIQSGMSGEQEVVMRETFWCREYIFDRLKSEWKFFHDNSVSGTVDLRNFLEKFDSRIVSTIYKGKSLLNVKIFTNKKNIKAGDQARISVTLEPTRGRTANIDKYNLETLNLWVFDHNTSKLLSKSNRRILFNGTLSKQVLTSENSTVHFDLLPVERGVYEICAAISKAKNSEQHQQFDSESIILEVN